MAALAGVGGCQCQNQAGGDGADDPATSPQPAGEASLRAPALRAELDLGPDPIRNPLNVYDIGLAGAPDYETAGTIDGVAVTMRALDEHSQGAFTRIGERLYQARDQGWRWLVERVSLDTQARAAGSPLMPFLLATYGELGEPPEAALDQMEASLPASLADLSGPERRAAARTLWRLEAWQARRDELIRAGRAEIEVERVRRQISNPDYAKDDTVVARVAGQPITRAERRILSGYQAALARHEYWRIAQMQFEKFVDRFLLEREAERAGVAVDALIQRQIERMPVPSDADVDAFVAENPEYGGSAEGRERARDNLRRLRSVGARAALLEELRAAAAVNFVLEEPSFERLRIEVPAPRWHGSPEAEDVLLAFHAVGCPNCTRGSKLILAVLDSRPGRFRLLAGDYFEPGRLDAYRGALALHCVPPQSRDWLLRSLTEDAHGGAIEALVTQATSLSDSAIDPQRVRDCLASDRFLPLIVENLAMARRLGLERSVPGLFVNGVRIGDLGDPESVLQQIDEALADKP
ncbi:thioredoxin domain-containing protein [Haliangium sp.]|uniref:thioredoxin domain-containing protein n=1 Tax=Haliangium sp. TaxID=2663208 RepID=UPI003D0A3D5D